MIPRVFLAIDDVFLQQRKGSVTQCDGSDGISNTFHELTTTRQNIPELVSNHVIGVMYSYYVGVADIVLVMCGGMLPRLLPYLAIS